MTSRYSKSYLLLFAAILLLMNIPKQASEKIRDVSVALLAPGWNSLNSMILYGKSIVGYAPIDHVSDSITLTMDEKIEYLQLQNQKLNSEIQRIKERGLHRQQKDDVSDVLVPARVIFRDLLICGIVPYG